MDCSPPGSSVHGILQARILEWVAMPFSRGSSPPREALRCAFILDLLRGAGTFASNRTLTLFSNNHNSFHLLRDFLLIYTKVLVTQSYLTLCDTMDYSLPGSSVHGILQARILEWVAIPFLRGSSWPRDWTWVSWIAPGSPGLHLGLLDCRQIFYLLNHCCC